MHAQRAYDFMCYPLKQDSSFCYLSVSPTTWKLQQLEQEGPQSNAQRSTIAKYLGDPENRGRHYVSLCALQLCFACAQEESEGIGRFFANTVC